MQVGISFINLNHSKLLEKEMINCSFGHNKSWIRAMKIKSWYNGESVIGVSYNMYTKLAENSNTNNTNLEKMGNVLFDMPGTQ